MAHQALVDDALRLCQQIGVAYSEAVDSLETLRAVDRLRFERCRRGHEPWPDELAAGFEAICTCEARCLYHDTQAAGSTEEDCNCAIVCPRHRIPRVENDRKILLPLSESDALLPIRLPTLAELGSFDHGACRHQGGICRLYSTDWEA